MTRDHSIEPAVVDARALLTAAEARLADSNFHDLAQIIATAEAELVSTSNVVIDGQAPEAFDAIQQLADLADTLDDDTLAAAGFASLREVASTLRSHVEDLGRVLALSRRKASPVGGKGPAAKDCVGELRPAALWCEPAGSGVFRPHPPRKSCLGDNLPF